MHLVSDWRPGSLICSRTPSRSPTTTPSPAGKVRESVSHGWPTILSGLKTLLETGERLP
ncbi:hypothetical protein [Allokutzneria sp. NRRL B-24872]|uniref:hypothetical protein n=1 Tax=Allokutzneria sp. NRRL B-24872 TaxID=1137961 RepID=UPI00143D63C6